MRLVLVLFGLVQVGVAIALASMSDDLVEVLVTGDPVEGSLAIDGVVQSDELLPNPAGEPFVFAHVTIRGPQGADGLRPVLWAGTVGDPDITLLTQQGEARVHLDGSPGGWKKVPVEASLLAGLDSDLAEHVPGWEAHAIDDEAFRVEVLALRKLDRVLVEMHDDGSLKSLWYGGARIREEALTRAQEPFRQTFDAFLWLTVVATMGSGLFCIGGGFGKA